MVLLIGLVGWLDGWRILPKWPHHDLQLLQDCPPMLPSLNGCSKGSKPLCFQLLFRSLHSRSFELAVTVLRNVNMLKRRVRKPSQVGCEKRVLFRCDMWEGVGLCSSQGHSKVLFGREKSRLRLLLGVHSAQLQLPLSTPLRKCGLIWESRSQTSPWRALNKHRLT